MMIFVIIIAVVIVPSISAVSSSELLAYYRFEEGTGNIIHDSSGNSCDGTSSDGITYESSAGNDSTGQYSLFYHDCLYSNTQYCINPSGLNSFTISAWVNMSYPPDGAWYYYNFDGSTSGFELDINLFGQPHIYMCNAGNCLEYYTLTSINLMEWTNVVMVFNYTADLGNRVIFYVNGVPQPMFCNGDGVNGDITSTMTGKIGILDLTGYCTYGMVDELAYINSSLSQDEITQIFNSGIESIVVTPPAPVNQGSMPFNTCPSTLPESFNMLILVLLAFGLLAVGLRVPIVGFGGGLMLFILSFYLIGCSLLIGLVLSLCGVISMIHFISQNPRRVGYV